MIKVESLTKKYDNTTAIADVTFTVEKGEVLGFLGPNGAGKTTAMRAITGFVPPTAGRITVDGFDVFEQPLEVRRRIGYLPENPPLYLEMTVEGYLRFVAKIKGVARSGIGDEVRRVMETVSLLDVSRRILSRLSKGYRQRVGLAQALINDPPILILDEPTVGLDPNQIHEVRELIKQWSGSHTVILSTHILPEVEQTCSRVVIIDRGRIIAEDTPGNLVRQLKGAEQTLLEVAGPIEEVLAQFQAIEGVATVREVGSSDGRHRVQVEANLRHDDLRPRLARSVVENDWGLFEMQSTRMSLEDIFIKLTTSDSDKDAGEPDVAPASPLAEPVETAVVESTDRTALDDRLDFRSERQ